MESVKLAEKSLCNECVKSTEYCVIMLDTEPETETNYTTECSDFKKGYTVKEIKEAGHMLEPVICIFCGEVEVTYHQYIGDGYCNTCGKWQEGDEV